MIWQQLIQDSNLAISIVNVSSLNEELRIDAEYHNPRYLDEESKLSRFSNIRIGDVAFVTDGQHGYHEEDPESEIRFLTAKNAGNWFADGENVIRVAKWVDDKNKRSSLKQDDLILSTRGTVGLCAIVGDEILPAQIDQDVARIHVEKPQLLPEYLLSFLNSTFGQDWIDRNSTGNVQQGLTLDKVRAIPIPLLSNNFQNIIKRIIIDAKKSKTDSVNLLLKVDYELKHALGFADFIPSTVNYSSRSSKDPTKTGRFDGEYWMSKYDEIEKKIAVYPHGYDFFDNLIEVSSETISPNADETYKYAELSNVDASIGLIEDAGEMYGNELPSRARMKLRKDDVVLSSVEGSADKVAIVKVENDKLVGSTGFFVLRKKALLPEVILALLRMPHINAIYKRQAQGTILTAVPRSSLSRVMMPKIPEPFQQEISSHIQEAHKLHNESKRLLEVAKRAVEVFIDQDENAALEYIKQNYEQV